MSKEKTISWKCPKCKTKNSISDDWEMLFFAGTVDGVEIRCPICGSETDIKKAFPELAKKYNK